MDSLEHIPEVQQSVEREMKDRSVISGRVELFRRSIQMIVEHKNCPEKEAIIEECERDINMKYEQNEITMQDRLILLHELYRRA